ncbi:MAG: ATP-dependent nuclease [Anaerostipes sp.]|jgi:putative ATP-dependent endonuclease of OLD family
MYISRVDINNFRNYEQFSIELKPFTVIIGENNIGKSNLLEAIALVLSNDIQSYQRRHLELEDINLAAINLFKRDILEKEIEDIEFPVVRIDLYLNEMDVNQETVVDGYWYDYDNKIARLSYIFSYKSKKRKQYLQHQKEMIEGKDKSEALNYIDFPIEGYEYDLVGGSEDNKVDSYYLKMLRMDYLDALRDAKRELNSNSDKKMLYKILNDREEDKFEDIKSSIIALDNAVKNDKSVLETLKKDIGTYLDKISLETEVSNNNVEFQFGSLELSEVIKKIGLQYGDNAISIDKNGLGRNNLLFIAVIMAHLYEKENEYFRLVALEEPEAHLCPVLQKHMSINLKDEENSKQQVIITTHSTHIASYLDLENTVILYKDHGKIGNHYVLAGFDESRAEDKYTTLYLQKWLNATNSTMFLSRKLIFVEGIAEEILIPVFYRWKYGKSLDKINCQVVNVNGVAFKHFLKIVKNGYFVKTVVLTDSDRGKKTENRADDLKLEFQSDNTSVHITDKFDTFEKEIFDANQSQKAKRVFITKVMSKVRIKKCGDEFQKEQNKKFDIDLLFECVEDYKSEFAFQLSDALIEAMSKTDKREQFSIPQYIDDAFSFINED